jgi:hypothetical protein
MAIKRHNIAPVWDEDNDSISHVPVGLSWLAALQESALGQRSFVVSLRHPYRWETLENSWRLDLAPSTHYDFSFPCGFHIFDYRYNRVTIRSIA